jgi:hypothetical protein
LGVDGKHRALVKQAALIAAVSIFGGAADACRLALILAMDVSNSVDAAEDRLQRQGMARALLSQDVQDAFFISPTPVALFVFEWSGEYNQQVLIDWTMIQTPADLFDVSTAISQSQRSERVFPTAMGYALGFAANQFRDVPDCTYRTIDVAGDGKNNHGFGPAEAYAAFPFEGVTVNGLVVEAGPFAGEVGLIPFYEDVVLRGPGSFLEVADGFLDYENTMRRKLLRELLAQVLGANEQPNMPHG